MNNISIYRPTRILSAASAADLIDWLNASLKAKATVVLIDLSQVLFMDSSGLGTLVTGLEIVQQAGGRLALCSLNGQARMLMEMTQMEKTFEIYDSPAAFEQALQQVKV